MKIRMVWVKSKRSTVCECCENLEDGHGISVPTYLQNHSNPLSFCHLKRSLWTSLAHGIIEKFVQALCSVILQFTQPEAKDTSDGNRQNGASDAPNAAPKQEGHYNGQRM